MSTRMNIYHTPRPIEGFLADFAGRETMSGYDATRPIKIAEENRDFVWSEEMCKDLIKSIFAGYPIPQMVICDNLLMDGGNRSTALKMWRQNEFTVRVGEWEGNYDAMTRELSARWNQCMIPMTIITNATEEERSNVFENYNKGIVLNFAQKIWNRKYKPLAKAACDLVYGGEFPFRDLISHVWKRTWNKTKTRSELALAYQVVVGSMFGWEYCSTKFSGAAVRRLMETPADQIDHSNLRQICEVFRLADPEGKVAPKQRAWVFKNFIIAAIHDFHNERESFVPKWREFLILAYATSRPELKKLKEVGTARANNLTRIGALARNISEYVAGTIVDGAAFDEEDDEEDDDSTE
jgi:hypothetical protein